VDRARSMGAQYRFQEMARGCADELAADGRQLLADGLGVVLARCLTGADERPGIDLSQLEACSPALLFQEALDCCGVDGTPHKGRQQDGRLIQEMPVEHLRLADQEWVMLADVQLRQRELRRGRAHV